MSEENVDGYIFDPNYGQNIPINQETVKDFFQKSRFGETTGFTDLIEIQVEKINEDYYLIHKKRRDKMNNFKTFAIYYWMKGKIYQASNLKVIMDAKINRISYFYDKINKKITEDFVEEEKFFKKTKKIITLKKEYL